ncbi:efflux RND transporter periplasmic adaptor subunit [Candidatus Sumerlaeota bacterium]|nr:efflux RND transporter periplasmic adaptor subunit [Candidatus Sumerlaeota bacterium]
MKRWIVLVVVVGFLGLVGWQVYHRATSGEGGGGRRGRGPSAVPVETAPVAKASIRDVRLFTGTLSPRSIFLIAPKTGGRLDALPVHIGDEIAQGQLIASIDDDEYQQQLEQAKAELDVARAEVEQVETGLEVAKREFDRMENLKKQLIVSASDYDTAESGYKTQQAREKVARAQYAEKEAALRAAQVRLSYTKIHASWEDGGGTRFVGERFVDEGAMLTANTPICSIVDIRTLTAVVHVIEVDYPRIRIGQDAVVETDAYPDRKFQGRIVRVAPVLKEESRQARVEIEVPNPDLLLKPGMFARVIVEFATHESATAVPPSAVTRRNEQTGVFLVDRQEKKARFVPIRVGIETLDEVEVLDPPLTGEVVTLGHHLLTDGSDLIFPGDNGERKSAEVETGSGRKPEDASDGGRTRR